MAAYVLANDGLPIFDATGAIIKINYAVQPVDHAGNVVNTVTSDGLPNNGMSPTRATPQPDMPPRVSNLITFITLQTVTAQAPTTTKKFASTPGQVNRKIIYYATKTGGALY